MGYWHTALRTAATTGARHLAEERRYRRASRLAGQVLAAVESERGPTPRAWLRQADAYARDVLGSVRFAPWLHVYCAVAGRFAEGWIPSSYYGSVVSPLKNGAIGRVTDRKTLTRRILGTDALPDLAYRIDGRFYARDLSPLDEADLPDLLFAGRDQVFFKADDSDQGRGLILLRRPDVAARAFPRAVDGVFQAPVRQHAFFADLSPRATATVRITTVRTPAGRIEARAAYLRVGRAGDAFVRSASSFRIPVDRDSGVLAAQGYLPDWRRAAVHPDTGARFAGRVLPCFDQARAACVSWHQGFPYLACIGWDIGVDRDGAVRLFEWNGRQNDIKFSEATTGPCFGDLGWEHLWKRARGMLPVA